jgi:GNAT superfamily N-acetyltransferase
MLEVKEFTTKEQMLDQLSVMQFLYPEFTFEKYEELLDEIIPNNYKQAAVFHDGKCLGISGFWIGTKLWCGKYLELDNVIVNPNYRSQGVGKLLTEYLQQKALDEGCKSVALDAYTNNFAAHKFYYNHGFVPKGFHFVKFLEDSL